jgi:hypothetical protein
MMPENAVHEHEEPLRLLHLNSIPVRRSLGIFDTVQVLALYQALNTLLDHVYIRFETGGELANNFAVELLMR